MWQSFGSLGYTYIDKRYQIEIRYRMRPLSKVIASSLIDHVRSSLARQPLKSPLHVTLLLTHLIARLIMKFQINHYVNI